MAHARAGFPLHLLVPVAIRVVEISLSAHCASVPVGDLVVPLVRLQTAHWSWDEQTGREVR